LFLGTFEECSRVLEYGLDGWVLDTVVGEVYEAGCLEGVENLEGCFAFGGWVTREESREVDELGVMLALVFKSGGHSYWND
jgi:hypothetical protein